MLIFLNTPTLVHASEQSTAEDSTSAVTDESVPVNNALTSASEDEGTTQAANTDDQTQPVKSTDGAVQTTIGNSVTDTQTYQTIGKTTETMNTTQNIAQTYFGLAGDEEIDQQLANLDSTTAANLNENGYLIKSGLVDNQTTLIVQGKDATGLFYGINHLNNLIQQQTDLSNVDISESPQMSIRGVIEGFYGQPWSQQARKDLFQFMGNHKMNVYIYSPKDDDYLRNNWKELYPQEKLNEIKDLVESAKESHVQFVYTLSPGNDITYSSQADFEKTVAKFNQLRTIGVSQFYIALDDIPLDMTEADAAKFKNHPTTNFANNPWSALADAQAFYINKVQRDYIKANNLPDLWLVPTNYSGSQQDPFKEAQGEALDKDIQLQWTGEGVFSGEITNESVEAAKKTYHTNHLFIWDNFPVNDSDQDRLYLNPLMSRSKQLYQIMDGFTSNPMIQPYASWFGLASYGDYMWNADTYSPEVNLQQTIRELAGNDAEAIVALQQFVDLNQYWDYALDKDKVHAPILNNFIQNFEQATYGTDNYQAAKDKLIQRLEIIINAPTTLRKMKTIGFYNDSLPWITAASHWGQAMLSGVKIMDKIQSKQTTDLSAEFTALNEQVTLAKALALPDSRTGKADLVITPTVGDGLFENFVDKVLTLVK